MAVCIVGLSYQCLNAFPMALLSATSKRVPFKLDESVVGESFPVKKPPANGLHNVSSQQKPSSCSYTLPESCEMDIMFTEVRKYSFFVASTNKVVLALIISRPHVPSLASDEKPLIKHFHGEIGYT